MKSQNLKAICTFVFTWNINFTSQLQDIYIPLTNIAFQWKWNSCELKTSDAESWQKPWEEVVWEEPSVLEISNLKNEDQWQHIPVICNKAL